MHKNHYLKIIVFSCLLVGGFLFLTNKGQAACLPNGSSCSASSECCSNACVGDVCCINIGGSCGGDSECCSNICYEGYCQTCLVEGQSCDSDFDCCTSTLSCVGGVCSGAGTPELDCMACGGDCEERQLMRVCANGSVITLNYAPGGCGTCQVSDPRSDPYEISMCCGDDPSNCLYKCVYEATAGCTDCSPSVQCVRYWEEEGSCPGGPQPPPGECSRTGCLARGYSNTQRAICFGGGDTCDVTEGSYQVSTDVCSGGWCECCGPPGPEPLSAVLSANPPEGCPSLNVTFTLGTTGPNINRWQIEYGDGTRACNPGPCTVAANGQPNGQTRNHTYNNPGIYNAVFTVWNSSNETAVSNRKVKVAVPVSHISNTIGSVRWDWPNAQNIDSYQFWVECYNRSIDAEIGYSLLDTLSNASSSYNQIQWKVCEAGVTKTWLLGQYWRNFNNDVYVVACKGADCTPSLSCSRAAAATSIENPNVVNWSCANDGSLLNINISTNEASILGGDFSYYHLGGNWGVNNNSQVKAKVEIVSTGALIAPIKTWLINPPFSDKTPIVLPTWPVAITPNVQYRVCTQAQNQNANPGSAGDLRPGPGINDWYCVLANCPAATCAPDTANPATCCNNAGAKVDATATRGAAPGASCVGATGNSCWGPTGGFNFTDPINGEIYRNNCCGDDTGECFISSAGVRCPNLVNANSHSCDGTTACCNNQNDWVNAGQCVVACPPQPPANLRHTANTTSSITWEWTHGQGAATTEVYLYNDGTGAFVGAQAVNTALPPRWVRGNLSINTRYRLIARSCNAAGCSVMVGPITAETSIENPAGISCQASSNSIQLTATGSFSNLSAGNSGIKFTNTSTGQGTGNFLPSITWTNTGLTPSTCYNYKAQACNSDCQAAGIGDYTTEVTKNCCTTAPPIENCTNNIDDDGDGCRDCQDSLAATPSGVCGNDCPPDACTSDQCRVLTPVCSNVTYDWTCQVTSIKTGQACATDNLACTEEVCLADGTCDALQPKNCSSGAFFEPCPDKCDIIQVAGNPLIHFNGGKIHVLDPANPPVANAMLLGPDFNGGSAFNLLTGNLANAIGPDCGAPGVINVIFHYDVGLGMWLGYIPGVIAQFSLLEPNKTYVFYPTSKCIWRTDGSAASVGDYCNWQGSNCAPGFACPFAGSTENCSDGLDNDCDGLIDTQDSDCPGSLADPACNVCACEEPSGSCYCFMTACGIDGDGCCPPGCNSTQDNDCSGPPPGCDPDTNASCCNDPTNPAVLPRIDTDNLPSFFANTCNGSCYGLNYPDGVQVSSVYDNLCCQDDSEERFETRVCYTPVAPENANLRACFSNAADKGCCRSATGNDCLYNGQCYSPGAVMSKAASGLSEPAYCDISLPSTWRDCDTNAAVCSTCGSTWVQGGEAVAAVLGEYDNGRATECCGDDANEYYKNNTCGDSTSACCNSASDVVESGLCVASCPAANNPPNAPQAIYPLNGDVTVPPEDPVNSNSGPTFRWRASDPDNDPLTHYLYFEINPVGQPGTFTLIYTGNAASGASLSFDYPTGAKLLSNQTYFWRVVVSDGISSNFATWQFTTLDNKPTAKIACKCPMGFGPADCCDDATAVCPLPFAEKCRAYSTVGMKVNANGSSDPENCPVAYPNAGCNLKACYFSGSLPSGNLAACAGGLYQGTSGLHTITLQVMDQINQLSAPVNKTIRFLRDAFADFDCCFGKDKNNVGDCLPGDWKNCTTIEPMIGVDKIWFRGSALSRASEGANPLVDSNYTWSFNPAQAAPNRAIVGGWILSQRDNTATLTITDSRSRQAAATKTIKAVWPPPDWWED